MAAKYIYQNGFLLLLFNFISTAALEKRFSDLKRCADEECSMLLVRGKALEDFRGPDCRFLSFKKSETVYVYYKLAGRRADMWAGSVGSSFGYFPKDLLAINHIYTDKEFEVPAQETDFVCFETGFDKFQSYDVDHLLGFLNEGSEDPSNITSYQVPESIQTDTNPPEENKSDVQEEQNASPNETEKEIEMTPSETRVALDTTPDSTNEQPTWQDHNVEVIAEVNETKEEMFQQHSEEEHFHSEDTHEPHVTPSGNVQIPELKTSFGTTFDAVVTEETTTASTTPAEEEMSEEPEVETPLLTKEETFQQHSEEEHFHSEDTHEPHVTPSGNAQIPELKTSFGTTFDAVVTEETTTASTTPAEEEMQEELEVETPLLTTDDVKLVDSLVEKQDDQKSDESMWSSFGDAVFSVVTGGEKTVHEVGVSSDEEDDDDDEDFVPPPKTFEEIKADKQPLDVKYPEHEQEMESEHLQEVNYAKANSEAEMLESESEVADPDDETALKIVKGAPQSDTVHEEESTQDEALLSQENGNLQGQNLPTQDNDTIVELDEKTNGSDATNATEETQESRDLVMPEEHLEENTTAFDVETNSHEFFPIEKVEISDLDIMEKENEGKMEENQERLDNNSQSVSITEEPMDEDIMEESIKETEPDFKEGDVELLEDENALSLPQMDTVDNTQPIESPDVPQISTPEPEDGADGPLSPTDKALDTHTPDIVPVESTPELEPDYSDDVMRLTVLREHLSEEKMERCQKYLGLKNLFKLEAMFEDLETELQATRQMQTGNVQEIENALESILESRENSILDAVEKILDGRESKYSDDQHVGSNIDEETEILDDFQEVAFSLRHKYSTVSDSAPVAEGMQDGGTGDQQLNVTDASVIVEDMDRETSTDAEDDHNLTSTHPEEQVTDTTKPEGINVDPVHVTVPDVSVEDEGGHFNRNQDNQQGFGTGDEMTKVPQSTLESALDMGLGVEVDKSPSGAMETLEPPSEFHEDEVSVFSTALVYLQCTTAMVKSKTTEWATAMMALLPDEWRPGQTLLGCPWEAVVVTAVVGILTFSMFFWRTVLAVKKREYLVDHKKLDEQIELLKREKNEALVKIAELQTQTQLLKENQKESAVSATSALKKMRALEKKVSEAEKQNEQMAQEKYRCQSQIEEERTICLKNGEQIEKLEKSNEKLQQRRKEIQEKLAKSTVLLDEAKIRDNARTIQLKSLEKDYAALKEENKSLKMKIKSREDKHKELSEQIKVYQKSQKELEDTLVQKDHNIEVLSDLLSDLEACDVQKGDSKVCANGELPVDKTTAIKNRIKQMMDVSRVQTTLAVVEEERDRFMSKLHTEEKARKSLEEQHQELEHAIATIKSEKSLVENHYKSLQQKNEIIVEMYQQKESALQQRLTKEEMERRSKESMLTEVGGKATEAEEQVRVLRQRINEMEEQMKKTEEMYKEQIKEQENKTHSNWITARNAERALNQEKVEASKLRDKLTVLTSQLNEKRAPLFRPNSGQFAGPRQGDSYGPSPVSGGAPSPPIMIEGPRRPPSAPVGRKIEPYGPRPPSDPHGRYMDNKHMSGMEMMGPRNSSPVHLEAPAEGPVSSESPEPGLGLFASPIKDCPGPGPGPGPGPVHPPGLGPHEPLLPPNRLPPPGAYRPMRPGPYGPGMPPPHHGPPLPANGHPGMPMGDFGPRPSNGHAFLPRPVPMDLRGPPPPHLRPPHYGPPPHVLRGPMGPHPSFHPDMRYPGPRASPPMDLPPPGALHPGSFPPYSGPYGPPPESLQNPGAHSKPGAESPPAAVGPAGAEP
ncbi:transport and Golgi organization protein 1 homolog isoform X2 [Eucyclogobius newberryi]|uniref:transport and Golgi organization protein 1 homolog isoform X2 n=1 Tax=Eucyclogobius newberryi TaxID=166745 RepID=UPI003B5A6BCD